MQEFTSLAALGRHFGRLALEGEAVTNRVTEKVADIVKQDAQVKIGVYQEAAGQFPAWAPLADSTVADRISKGFSPLEPLLRTGELRDSIETHVEGAEATVGSASMIALYQEQGHRANPAAAVPGPGAVRRQGEDRPRGGDAPGGVDRRPELAQAPADQPALITAACCPRSRSGSGRPRTPRRAPSPCRRCSARASAGPAWADRPFPSAGLGTAPR